MAKSDDGSSPPQERLHALDAVRGLALLSGVFLHAAISFLPIAHLFWVVEDIHTSTTLAILVFVIHIFRMTTFFLIAGFFAHMSFHRRGPGDFIIDRLRRIALPLVVGWPIIFAATAAVVIWALSLRNGGSSLGAQNWLQMLLPRFSLFHLWFLYVLLELYAAVLLLRSATVWLDRTGRIRSGIDRLIALIVRSLLAPAILALPIGIVFVLDPTWVSWLGVRTPDSLVTNLQAVVCFGTAFGFGWLLHRQVALIQMMERRWLLNLVVGLALTVVSLALAGLPPRPIFDTTRIVGCVCYALTIWTMAFAVIGIALRFLSGFSATRRYIADASYWLYLIHPPIIIALQVAVSRLDWPWPAKYATILLIAFPVMFASYQFLVRYSFIGTVLNGRRIRRAPQATELVRSHL
jgi:glucans biosynthesis protein C